MDNKRKSSLKLFALMVFILPFAAWMLVSWYEREMQSLPILGRGKSISSFSVTNQDSQLVDIKSWQNKIVVVDFFFTHCPVICPKMTSSMKKISEANKHDKELQLASFTVDPSRDNPSTLKEYARRFKISTKNWDLLTGDKKELYKLARNSFRIVATDGDGGENDFIHSDKFVLIDRQLRIRGYYEGTNSKEVEQLIKDIKKLRHEN